MSIQFKVLDLTSSDNGRKHYLIINGKLEKNDYALFVPVLEAGIKKHGSIDLLIELQNFHGWTAGAAWEDTRFGVRHFNDIDKLAIVGDRKWEENLIRFAKVFTRAQLRYFDHKKVYQAYAWLNSNAKEVNYG